MWRSRMFWQLFCANAVLIIFSLGLFSYLAVSQLEHAELTEIEGRLQTQALLIKEALRERNVTQEQLILDRIKQILDSIQNLDVEPTRITLIDHNGRVVLDSLTNVR